MPTVVINGEMFFLTMLTRLSNLAHIIVGGPTLWNVSPVATRVKSINSDHSFQKINKNPCIRFGFSTLAPLLSEILMATML